MREVGKKVEERRKVGNIKRRKGVWEGGEQGGKMEGAESLKQ